MLSTAYILSILQEQKECHIKNLAEKLEIKTEDLKKILNDLNIHNLIEYDPQTGKVKLPAWLRNIDRKIETIKPAIGEIILPRYQEAKIYDVTIGNYTKNDLQLRIRVKPKLKEIAICNVGSMI